MFKLEHKFYDKLEDILEPIEFIKNGKNLVSNVPCVFDIEVSSFYEQNGEKKEKRAVMYAWVFGINGKCIRGRTWNEFMDTINHLIWFYELSLEKRLLIFCHNLSYEFQFLRKLFIWSNVFSIDERKPIYAIAQNGIEFRCSYLLSGMSLKKVGENLTLYPIQKMVGDLDYSKLRHPNTPLTDKEWGYILNDGLVVMAYVQELIERYNGINNIPITNTGFVRMKCRDNCLRGKESTDYHKLMKELVLTEEDYKQCKQAFAGGYTHGSCEKVGKTLVNVGSFDRCSSYPGVMVSYKYPMSPPRRVEVKTMEQLKHYLENFCCLIDITFNNIRERSTFEHYISASKCYEKEHYVLDNGRIVEADKVSLVITEVDYLLINEYYDYDSVTIHEFKIMNKDYLPKEFLETILEFYNDKTTLKDVEGKEVEYMLGKGMLNSIYGMCVTDICRDLITYTSEGDEWGVQPVDYEEAIAKYNSNTNRFISFLWGIWCTCYARLELHIGILHIGKQGDYIYSDTDSIKCTNYEKYLPFFEQYNKRVTEMTNKCLRERGINTRYAHPKTKKGVVKQIGVFEFEYAMERFKTLGAKRYMYTTENKLHLTISGVAKKDGEEYLMFKHKGNLDKIFDDFNDKLEFPATYESDEKYIDELTGEVKKKIKQGCGKQTHTYIDDETEGVVKDYLGNFYNYHELSSIHMESCAYSLSLDKQFIEFLKYNKVGNLC